MSSVWMYSGTINGDKKYLLAEDADHARYEFNKEFGVTPDDVRLVPGTRIICD